MEHVLTPTISFSVTDVCHTCEIRSHFHFMEVVKVGLGLGGGAWPQTCHDGKDIAYHSTQVTITEIAGIVEVEMWRNLCEVAKKVMVTSLFATCPKLWAKQTLLVGHRFLRSWDSWDPGCLPKERGFTQKFHTSSDWNFCFTMSWSKKSYGSWLLPWQHLSPILSTAPMEVFDPQKKLLGYGYIIACVTGKMVRKNMFFFNMARTWGTKSASEGSPLMNLWRDACRWISWNAWHKVVGRNITSYPRLAVKRQHNPSWDPFFPI